MKGTMEIISTEDGLARIDLFNKQQDEVSEKYTFPPEDGGGGNGNPCFNNAALK